jgi:hypothetical protein
MMNNDYQDYSNTTSSTAVEKRNGTSLREDIAEVKENLFEDMSEAKEKIADQAIRWEHKVTDKLQQAKEFTTDKLRNTSQQLEQAAHYIEEAKYPDVAESVKHSVKKYPTQWLMAAIGLGFMVGKAFR